MKEKPTEQIMQDFLDMLDKDGEELGAEFLLKFIRKIIEDTMDLGSKGFQPLLNMTLFARGSGADTELIFRPTRSNNHELYEMLKVAKLGLKVMEAWKEYGLEAWGMTSMDEREDLRVNLERGKELLEQWRGLKDG